MPRMSHAEMATVVRDAITAGGGRVSHDELLAQLRASGNEVLVNQLISLQSLGYIQSEVIAQSPEEMVALVYSLPE